MDEQDIREIMNLILERVGETHFNWRIEGSVNLRIQGVHVSVRDLDITTDEEGIEIFRVALSDYVVKDFFSEKIKGTSLICDFFGFEVEINSYGDRDNKMFDKSKVIFWKGLGIPVLPLKYAKKFYEEIGREDRAKLISEYL